MPKSHAKQTSRVLLSLSTEELAFIVVLQQELAKEGLKVSRQDAIRVTLNRLKQQMEQQGLRVKGGK